MWHFIRENMGSKQNMGNNKLCAAKYVGRIFLVIGDDGAILDHR